MDLEKSLNDAKHPAYHFLFKRMPNYISSKHRVHRMFFKHCETDINQYQTCLNDYNWRANIDKYIPDTLQQKCYKEWVKVRRCAVKHLGDSFAMKINISREIEPIRRTHEDLLEQYENLIETKVDMLKELSSDEEEEEGEEEEEAEEEAEEESSDEPTEEESEKKSEEGEDQTEEAKESEEIEEGETKQNINEEKGVFADNNKREAIKEIQANIDENKDEKQTKQEKKLQEKKIKQLENTGVSSSDITPQNFHDAATLPTAEDDRKLSNAGQGLHGGSLTQDELTIESSDMAKAKDAEIIKHPELANELNKKEFS